MVVVAVVIVAVVVVGVNVMQFRIRRCFRLNLWKYQRIVNELALTSSVFL